MDKKIYINLLYKSLAEGLSAKEQSQLDDWLKASKEHQEIAQNIRQGWDLSANYSKDFEVNLDDDFARLQKSMDLNMPQANADVPPMKVVETAKVKTMRPWKTWMGVAAAVLLLVTTYFVFNPNGDETSNFVTIETHVDEIKEVDLPDGTKVWVNENSIFTYPNKFADYNRKVELKGLAFFDVARDEKKPFTIKTKDVNVKVLGTSFSVRDYLAEQQVEVLVKTGKVEMIPNNTKKRAILIANNKGTFNKETQSLDVSKSNSLNELSWQNKTLIFDDTPLANVISDVGNHYGIVLNLKDSNLAECPFNSIFKNNSLEEVFDAISKVLKIEIEKTDNYVYNLKGGQCNVN